MIEIGKKQPYENYKILINNINIIDNLTKEVIDAFQAWLKNMLSEEFFTFEYKNDANEIKIIHIQKSNIVTVEVTISKLRKSSIDIINDVAINENFNKELTEATRGEEFKNCDD